ncbi:MAG: restriction endonuclease subunit S, partial [Anaerolineae bacterium]|nr:restriction endonuclease subunit S [Anaerolineae bacterium]
MVWSHGSLLKSPAWFSNTFCFANSVLTFSLFRPFQFRIHSRRNVVVAPKDILLNITGDSVARVCQVPNDVLPARVNQHVAIIRPDAITLNADYVKYYLVSPHMQAYMLMLAGAGATRNALTKGMIEDFIIPAPPLPEQRAIAAILSSFDDKIELNRRMNATLEATARALFKSWFVDFDPVRARMEGRQPEGMDAETAALFPDRLVESALGLIPEGWRVGTLSEAIDINPPRPLSRGVVAPYVEMANMPTASARILSWVRREFGSGMRFKNGDVLLARITPCLENGKTAFVDFMAEDEVGWGSTEYIVLRSKHPLPPEYIYFLARTEKLREFAIQSMTGTSGRQRVPAEALENFPVIVPSEPIAQLFGEFAAESLNMMRAKDNESRTLAAARDALLPKLVSGQVRVGDEA